MNESNYSTKVSSVFKKIYGVPISIRFIRMSHSTWLHKQNPTARVIKDYTEMMAHSPHESALYKKYIK